MSQERLTKKEFAAAFKHGLGRALIFVQKFGLAEVADLVLESCLKNPAYDRQCESGRAAWLINFFKDSQEYSLFSMRILSALDSETDEYDVEHLFQLLAQMAIHGDEAAGKSLRSRVLGQPFTDADTQLGCRALVALDGVDAVVELARRFGKLDMVNPEDRPPMLGYLADELEILPQVEFRLQQLAGAEPEIQAFMDKEGRSSATEQETPETTKVERQQRIRDRVRSELSIEKILVDAAAGIGGYASKYMRFGKYATEEELRTVLQHLVISEEEKSCLRLLWVFRRAPLPELHQKIWEFSESKNDVIRAAAIEALAQNTDSRIGEFGRAKLRSPSFSENDSEILDIFIRNYQAGDEILIMSALRRLSPNDENAHSLGSSVIDICEEIESPAFAEMIEWVYETNPCTICRHSAVKWMFDMGCMPSQIASECLFDANEDIQKLAQRHVQSA